MAWLPFQKYVSSKILAPRWSQPLHLIKRNCNKKHFFYLVHTHFLFLKHFCVKCVLLNSGFLPSFYLGKILLPFNFKLHMHWRSENEGWGNFTVEMKCWVNLLYKIVNCNKFYQILSINNDLSLLVQYVLFGPFIFTIVNSKKRPAKMLDVWVHAPLTSIFTHPSFL